MNISKKDITTDSPEIRDNVLAYIAGDSSAFNKIKNYLETIIRDAISFRKRFVDFNNIEDIRQECWIEILLRLPRWNPDRGHLRPFLFKCLSNRIVRYCYSSASGRQYIPVGDVEPYMDHEQNYPFKTGEDLNIEVRTRFSGPLEIYIIRRIAVALYLRAFEHRKGQIISELKKMSGRPERDISFMVDYALVTLRRECRGIK